MEDNKCICPNCGTEMIQTYEKPALNFSCSKCGCKIATTKWEDIDLDDEVYSIYLEPIENPEMGRIKFISEITGKNYISSKSFLKNGGLLFKGSAVNVLEKEEKTRIKFLSIPY